MARPALIDKLFQIGKWVFKKELIPLDDLLGDMAGNGLTVLSNKLNVDFAAMPKAQIRQLVLGMIQTGGGLMVDSQDKIYFDPESMDTAVFEKMMKTLKLPIWLTKNTTFYVDKSHANAGNTLIEGRGLSRNLPFASIQPCISFVCENYNFASNIVKIEINDGVYEEAITLMDYARTTGALQLWPRNLGSTRTVTIRNPANTHSPTVSVAGTGSYSLYELNVEHVVYPSSSAVYSGAIIAETACDLLLFGMSLEIKNAAGAFPDGGRATISLLSSGGGCLTQIRAGVSLPTLLTTPAQAKEGVSIVGLQATANGTIYLRNGYTISKAICSGHYLYFARANLRGIIALTGSGDTFSFEVAPGKSVTGQRYDCKDGGSITCRQGPDYFPGSIAGKVEPESYCSYL
ncbi:MAG: hypothetical protein K2H64_01930 [Desulfovibrio sp.]|nr:hypothetical protein [Desulfovibrio sp.]